MTLNHTTPSGDPVDQPEWRKQFPIETAAEAHANRRGFLGGLAVAGVTMGVGAVGLQVTTSSGEAKVEFLKHEPLVLQKKLPDMSDGEALLFHYPDPKSPCLLIRLTENKFVAFSQKCTHLACPVIPRSDLGELHCPCHKGVFDLTTGTPKSGPPKTPLPQIQIELSTDGTLTAVGKEESRSRSASTAAAGNVGAA